MGTSAVLLKRQIKRNCCGEGGEKGFSITAYTVTGTHESFHLLQERRPKQCIIHQ